MYRKSISTFKTKYNLLKNKPRELGRFMEHANKKKLYQVKLNGIGNFRLFGNFIGIFKEIGVGVVVQGNLCSGAVVF